MATVSKSRFDYDSADLATIIHDRSSTKRERLLAINLLIHRHALEAIAEPQLVAEAFFKATDKVLNDLGIPHVVEFENESVQ